MNDYLAIDSGGYMCMNSLYISIKQFLFFIKVDTIFIILSDILLGLPSTTPGNLTAKLQEEHTKFLVAELKNTVSDSETCGRHSH